MHWEHNAKSNETKPQNRKNVSYLTETELVPSGFGNSIETLLKNVSQIISQLNCAIRKSILVI